MSGISLYDVERICLACVAVCLLGFLRSARAGEADPESQPPGKIAEPIDPFLYEDRAKETLAGIWEYSAEYSVKPMEIRTPPGLFGPDSEHGWPLEKQKLDKAVQPVRKMSSLVRLDLRSKRKFRIEVLLTDHSAKTYGYTFGEGAWQLRGRLLVLTFLQENELDRWGFFVERLADDEVVVTGIDESGELLKDGRGVLIKKKRPAPLTIPDGYSVQVDEVSFGSATADVAEYLRNNLNLEVETPKER